MSENQEIIPPDQDAMLNDAGATDRAITKFYAIVISAFAWVFTYGFLVLFAILTHPIRDAIRSLTKG